MLRCDFHGKMRQRAKRFVSLISVSADLICHGFECAMRISIPITFNHWHSKLLAMCKPSRSWTNYIEAISVFNVHITHEYSTTCYQNHFKWTHVLQSMDQWVPSAIIIHITHASSHSSAFCIILSGLSLRFGFYFSNIFFVGVTYSMFKCRMNLFPAFSNSYNNNIDGIHFNNFPDPYSVVLGYLFVLRWLGCAFVFMKSKCSIKSLPEVHSNGRMNINFHWNNTNANVFVSKTDFHRLHSSVHT